MLINNPNKIRRIQTLQRIREALIQGKSYNTIISETGVSDRQFYRLLKKAFAADIKNLSEANERSFMRQVAIHVERANSIYSKLENIAADSSVAPEWRIEALQQMFLLSRGLIDTMGSAPAAALNHKRRLAAVQRGIPESVYNSYTSRYLPPAIYDPNSPDLRV